MINIMENFIKIETITITIFLLVAAISYSWIGFNFIIDDRKLNRVIAPLMLLNSVFYFASIFYVWEYNVKKIMLIIILSNVFWSITTIPIAEKYFKERNLRIARKKDGDNELIQIISFLILNNKITINEMREIGLSEDNSSKILSNLYLINRENENLEQKNEQ